MFTKLRSRAATAGTGHGHMDLEASLAPHVASNAMSPKEGSWQARCRVLGAAPGSAVRGVFALALSPVLLNCNKGHTAGVSKLRRRPGPKRYVCFVYMHSSARVARYMASGTGNGAHRLTCGG